MRVIPIRETPSTLQQIAFVDSFNQVRNQINIKLQEQNHVYQKQMT